MYKLIILCLSLISYKCLSETIFIGHSILLPPYVIKGGGGIETQVIQEAFASVGVKVEFKGMRTKHSATALDKNKVDGIVILFRSHLELLPENRYDSEPLLFFENAAISFKDKTITIDKLEDLAGKRIVAFYNAKHLLTKEFRKAIEAAGTTYTERPSHFTMAKLLFAERYDVIITEKRMFTYWLEHAKREGTLPSNSINPELSYININQSSPRKIRFKNPKLRTLFNKGLRNIKASGRYDQIISSF